MTKQSEHRNIYTIEYIAEDSDKVTAEPNQLAEDPLENLPDLSAQSGGLPIVAFVLFCLAAFAIVVLNKLLTAPSLLVIIGCGGILFIMVFGIVALIRGMFSRLHQLQSKPFWYTVSLAVMLAAILLGLIVGFAAWR